MRGGHSPNKYRMSVRQVPMVNGERSSAWLEKKKAKVSYVPGSPSGKPGVLTPPHL